MEPITCEENLFYEGCEQLDNAKFQNHACKSVEVYSNPYFFCTNREDKIQEMFENPPIPTNVYYSEVTSFNTVLSFDEKHIYCGVYNFTYKDFNEIRKMHGKEFCRLLDGNRLTIWALWGYLLVDFSFKGTQKIGDFL